MNIYEFVPSRDVTEHIRTMLEKPPENKALFYAIDALCEGITMGKQVSFQYISNYGTDIF